MTPETFTYDDIEITVEKSNIGVLMDGDVIAARFSNTKLPITKWWAQQLGRLFVQTTHAKNLPFKLPTMSSSPQELETAVQVIRGMDTAFFDAWQAALVRVEQAPGDADLNPSDDDGTDPTSAGSE